MARVLDNFLEGEDWISVEKNDYKVSDSEVIGVDCLGTCLGLAAFDSKTKEGYLLHAATLENEELEQQINEFIDELEDLSAPYEVLAAGTMNSRYNPLSDQDFTEEARDTLEAALEQNGIEYEASWNEEPVYNRLVVSPEYGILYDNPEEEGMQSF